jgi:hypothetical protein
MMLEARIEDYLVREVHARGGETRKVSWIGRRGAPDRLVLLPPWGLTPRYFMAELKRPEGTLAGHQEREIKKLRYYRIPVEICWSKEQIDQVLAKYDEMVEWQRSVDS